MARRVLEDVDILLTSLPLFFTEVTDEGKRVGLKPGVQCQWATGPQDAGARRKFVEVCPAGSETGRKVLLASGSIRGGQQYNNPRSLPSHEPVTDRKVWLAKSGHFLFLQPQLVAV